MTKLMSPRIIIVFQGVSFNADFNFICDALCDLVPFVQFKKRENPWVFFTLFKLYKWHQIVQRITYFKLLDIQEEPNHLPNLLQV